MRVGDGATLAAWPKDSAHLGACGLLRSSHRGLALVVPQTNHVDWVGRSVCGVDAHLRGRGLTRCAGLGGRERRGLQLVFTSRRGERSTVELEEGEALQIRRA